MKKLFLFLAASVFAQANAQVPAYYNSIDFTLNGVPLKNALATLITNTHTNELSYNEVWNALKIVDADPANANNVLLIYGWPNTTTGVNARTRAKSMNGGSQGDWNREHTYAKSLGTPDLGESGPGADAHHLRASDVDKNGARGNRKFASNSGNSGAIGSNWYPGDEWKGDVARMMMYMYVRYGTRCLPGNVGVGSTTNTPDGMIDLFLQWNVEDPVSNFERGRNTYMNSSGNYAQGNRNPFIDNPFLASKIWGGPFAEDTWGLLSNAQLDPLAFGLYPNPSNDGIIHINTSELVSHITIYSVDGKVIRTIVNPKFSNNEYSIDAIPSGIYFIQLKSDSKQSTKKFIIK